MQQIVIKVKLFDFSMKPSSCESLEKWKNYILVLPFEYVLHKGLTLKSKRTFSVKVHVGLKAVAC